MAKKQALGKGLGALIKKQGNSSELSKDGVNNPTSNTSVGSHENDVRKVAIAQVVWDHPASHRS